MMGFEAFENKTLNAKKSRKFKVSGSIGVYDLYKLIRKNKWYNLGRPLKEGEFYSVIREVNTLLAKNIAEGISVHLPHKMGTLELRKAKKGASIVNGKLKITYPINWEETLKLWEEDEQAKKDKVLIRRNDKYVYKVYYNKYKATYNNKSFYQFVLNRFIKKALKENINQNLIDTLW